jgi:hypothetical protein
MQRRENLSKVENHQHAATMRAMKTSRRHIRLSYPDSGISVIAEMLDDEAPNVCKAIWDMLPIESKVIHGMYSGAEVFAMVDNPQPLNGQNLVQIPLPGELLYYYEANLGAAGGKKPVGEIVVVYGRGVILREHEGIPTKCSLFGRIPGDWKYDWTAFAQECRKARWEGPRLLRIERVENA